MYCHRFRARIPLAASTYCCCCARYPWYEYDTYLGALKCVRVSGIQWNGKCGQSCRRDSSTAQDEYNLAQHPSDPLWASEPAHNEIIALCAPSPMIALPLPTIFPLSPPLELEIFVDRSNRRSKNVCLRYLRRCGLFFFRKCSRRLFAESVLYVCCKLLPSHFHSSTVSSLGVPLASYTCFTSNNIMLQRTVPRAFSTATASLRGLPLDGNTINENVKSAKVRILAARAYSNNTASSLLKLPAWCLVLRR